MTLNGLVKALQELVDEGKGNLQVYCRDGASGQCSPLGSPHVFRIGTVINDDFDDGPYDCPDSEYVEIYGGN